MNNLKSKHKKDKNQHVLGMVDIGIDKWILNYQFNKTSNYICQLCINSFSIH
jgi:hypothetical protein